MVMLRKTLESELTQIVELEQHPEVNDYITPASLAEHQKDFTKHEVTYLTITHEGNFAGFVILVHHPDSESVECVRIAVRLRQKGIGQQALQLMEDYCMAIFNPKRIWLDVFAFNKRGIHVYRKLGYQQFNTGAYQGKELLYLEKLLST